MPIVAGVEVDREHVLELASMLTHHGSDHSPRILLDSITAGRDVSLTIDDRESILAVLDECPDGLAELRAVLLAEHVGRKREGP